MEILLSSILDWNSVKAVTMPLKVAATFVKLAIPPPIMSTYGTDKLVTRQSICEKIILAIPTTLAEYKSAFY